jgi:TrmH family RNA methyltransferase
MAGTRHKGGPGAVADNISIVLVEPAGPGNIGSVSRAMKNTGFSELVLVNPAPFKNDEGLKMACNASDVLLGARVVEELSEALKGAGVIAGATRRLGRIRQPVLMLDEAVVELMKLGRKNKVSILFGREDKGLKNPEIKLCDILFEIPSAEACPSLNLSHAVFIVCHKLYTAIDPPGPRVKSAPRSVYDEMFVHMESAFKTLGYGEQGREYLLSAIMRTFRRLFGRTALMTKEVNMLRGIFTQIERRVGKDPAD